MHILIADDDAVCRSFVEEMAKSWGFTVSLAADGEEAMAAVRANPAPEILILDWMMPKLDGFEVCRRLKQSGQGLYIIMITGGGHKDDLIKPLVAGADDYIVKPFEGLDLKLHLRNAVTIIKLRAENADLRAQLAGASQRSPRPAPVPAASTT